MPAITTIMASLNLSIQRKPVRITLTVPCSVYEELLSRSDAQGRSLSNLAAHLLEQGLSAGTPQPVVTARQSWS